MALLVGHWTCDLQVACSSPGRVPLRNGLGQATYTCVSLWPSSIIWYWPRGHLFGGCESNREPSGSIPLGLWLNVIVKCWKPGSAPSPTRMGLLYTIFERLVFTLHTFFLSHILTCERHCEANGVGCSNSSVLKILSFYRPQNVTW